jgi:hypothetical protein
VTVLITPSPDSFHFGPQDTRTIKKNMDEQNDASFFMMGCLEVEE